MNLDEAKKQFTIKSIWDAYKLPGDCSQLCKNPFTDNESLTFRVGERGPNEHWEDTRTGDNGDVIEFFARCAGISDKQAAATEYIKQAELFVNNEFSPEAVAPMNDELAHSEPTPSSEATELNQNHFIETGKSDPIEFQDNEVQLSSNEKNRGNPFPVNAVPPIVANMAEYVASQTGVQVENIVPLIFGATSISIGKGAVLEDSNGLCTRPNVYIIVSQETGTGKTLTFRMVFDPIEKMQDELQEQWHKEEKHSLHAKLAELEIESKRAKAKIRDNEQTSSQEHVQKLASISQHIEQIQNRLNPPILMIEDVNPASIEQILQQHNGNLSIAGSEARNVADSLMGKGKTIHQSIYFKGFDCESIRALRSSLTDKYFSVHEPALQITISMQPDKMEGLYSSKDAHESGLLGRILVAGHTGEMETFPTRPLSPDAKNHWNDLIQNNLKTYRMRTDKPQVFGLEKGGLEVLNKMTNEITLRIKDCTYLHVRNAARRRVEYVRKFALLLHLLKHPENPPSKISLKTLDEAKQVESWFFENLLEFRASAIRKDELDDEAKVLERLEMHPEGLSRNQIRRDCRLPNAEATKQVLDRLHAAEKVIHWTTQPKGGGTRSDMYKVA